MRRDTQVVAGLAVFIIAVGVVAAVIVANNDAASTVKEPIWIRITSNDNIPTLSTVYIYDENGHEAESFVYYNEGEWQSGKIEYGVNVVITVLIDIWESEDFIQVEYKIGRGMLDVSGLDTYVEIYSYWSEPD